MNPENLDTLIYEKRGGIAYVTLNRPEVMNALSPGMVSELVEVWQDVRDDRDVQVVVLTGAGDAFLQGRGDTETLARLLEEEASPPGRPFRYGSNTPVSPKAHDVFKPVIAAVNGVCATSGLEQVAEADIVICSENATFFDNHVSFGAMVHSAVGLAKRMSYNHVVRMALMGSHEVIDARRAYEIGLVTEVVPSARLIPRATEIAETIMLNSPTAVQASVEALWHSLSLGLRDALQLDSYMQRYYKAHPDTTEGMRAIVEARPPTWREP